MLSVVFSSFLPEGQSAHIQERARGENATLIDEQNTKSVLALEVEALTARAVIRRSRRRLGCRSVM
jgi:hypothetical protein